jgi:hypothetical protein
MKFNDVCKYVAFGVDDAGQLYSAGYQAAPIGTRMAIVGWQCGFEPMCVAVWSYLPDCVVAGDDAVDIATDALAERRWFAGEPIEPDFVIFGRVA